MERVLTGAGPRPRRHAGRRGVTMLAAAALLLALAAVLPAAADTQDMRRVILAVQYSDQVDEVREGWLHRAVEMPLNHLGLVLKPHDVHKPLPTLDELADVRGVITWFDYEGVPDPIAFLDWATAIVDSGRKFVIMGVPGFLSDEQGRSTPLERVNAFLARLGVARTGDRAAFTYDYEIARLDTVTYNFERELGGVLPPFDRYVLTDARARSHLTLRNRRSPDLQAELVVSHPNGGMVAPGYGRYYDPSRNRAQWLLEPFRFFADVFQTAGLPKPDTTTLNGRRIYYSHIDGDGWNNISQVPEYREQRALSAVVVQKEVIERYADLPVTVAPIAAELDPAWRGKPESQAAAREMFMLEHVEPASHTYSHPFDWTWFRGYHPADEVPFLPLYFPDPGGRRMLSFLRAYEAGDEFRYQEAADRYAAAIAAAGPRVPPRTQNIADTYDAPRAYGDFPFNLEREMMESVAYISQFAPPGKTVTLLQWSGDCVPWERAIEETREVGVANMNGGDSRFDLEYDSRIFIAPVGRIVGREIQIYASNSNENTYTDLWRDRFFGFRDLVTTLENTESPVRLKPINIYYHMYSGERVASLRALRANVEYALAQEIAPIFASRYARIAHGFFTTRIDRTGDWRFRIRDRGQLQTLRFDDKPDMTVDFAASIGVIGQRRHQGSLYVALDETVAEPVLQLRPAAAPSPGTLPWLVQSRWRVYGVAADDDGGVRFSATGFGRGEMAWQMPQAGRYRVTVGDGEAATVRTDRDGRLVLALEVDGHSPVRVAIERG